MKAIEHIQLQPVPARRDVQGSSAISHFPWAFLAGLSLGSLLAIVFGSSLLGIGNPLWYLTRSSAMIGYVLLWAAMALGIGITNKLARAWPGGPTAFDLHQYFSWLGIAFTTLHVLTLLGDQYIDNTVAQWLLPFASTGYEQFWVGLGQVSFYLLIPVLLSFYARKRLGTRAWRTIHGLSYALFALGLLHGLFSGTDGDTNWAPALYWFTGVSLLALTIYRIIMARRKPHSMRAS